jgi:hypothetical protein
VRQDRLTRFTPKGRQEMIYNAAEGAIQPQALEQKN